MGAESTLEDFGESIFFVVFVVLRYNTPGKKLEAFGHKKNIHCFCVPNVNETDFMRRIQIFCNGLLLFFMRINMEIC